MSDFRCARCHSNWVGRSACVHCGCAVPELNRDPGILGSWREWLKVWALSSAVIAGFAAVIGLICLLANAIIN